MSLSLSLDTIRSRNRTIKKGSAPRIIGVFSFRYDYGLVPDLIENISPFVDGWVSWDDRQRTELWYHEGKVRNTLIQAAQKAGADWILAIDPDERFEKQMVTGIDELTSIKKRVIYGFKLREMYTPTSYRVDGIWGEKISWRLFPVFPNQEFPNQELHSGWFPIETQYDWVKSDFQLYHLKMIKPENRAARRDLYNFIDKEKVQEIGYDYLANDTAAKFELIQSDREYLPPYNENYSDLDGWHKEIKAGLNAL